MSDMTLEELQELAEERAGLWFNWRVHPAASTLIYADAFVAGYLEAMNRRAEPEPAAAEAQDEDFLTLSASIKKIASRVAELDNEITRIMARVAGMQTGADITADALSKLAARLTALEQIAASAPRAGDGYREITAGERGEGG